MNMPDIKLGLVAVSRDCFPIELSRSRRSKVAEECRRKKINVVEIETVVENERDVLRVLDDVARNGINALVIYLGNFGPEGPLTLLAQRFGCPVMLVAAAEETASNLTGGRGDAYCGMLNASYNSGLRKLRVHIPEYPVGTPEEIAGKIAEFAPVARVIAGLARLKIFSFGPRPQDFLACNAPIKPLYDLGVEIMESSELDLYDAFLSKKGDESIGAVVKEMEAELGSGNTYPDLLPKLAQFEVALTSFMEANLGASEYGIFANKCWPSFEKYFGFVPCYVNSRLASKNIPVSCEVDIYGALSEYMTTCATGSASTILDINNTVPDDMYGKLDKKYNGYKPTDLFMGFHCGNTPSCCMADRTIKYQLIMHRLMEQGKEPDITRGTLEGRIKPGAITLFRLQSKADTEIASYMAEGEVLDADPKSFGGIGVFGIREMARFYRHVLIAKKFPHHTAVGFGHCGKTLFDSLRTLGMGEVYTNLPETMRYENENPFA